MTLSEKTRWIAAARAAFRPGARTVCAVCGKFEAVAQVHHVIPLERQHDRGVRVASHDHVWLCPTHHAIVHLLLNARAHAFGSRPADILSEMSVREASLLLGLVRLAGGPQR